MSILDWLIVLLPVAFVMYMAVHSRSYVRSVADYLAAGRICGRYVISVADVANALVAITSDVEDLQGELNLVWDCILPVL